MRGSLGVNGAAIVRILKRSRTTRCAELPSQECPACENTCFDCLPRLNCKKCEYDQSSLSNIENSLSRVARVLSCSVMSASRSGAVDSVINGSSASYFLWRSKKDFSRVSLDSKILSLGHFRIFFAPPACEAIV